MSIKIQRITPTLHLRVENCVFSGNKAIDGAAVHIAGYVDLELPKIWGRDYSASILGASMYINVTQTTFLQNIAEESGGSIHIDCFMFTLNPDELQLVVGEVRVTCLNCNFIENKAENGYAVNIDCKQDPHAYNGLESLTDESPNSTNQTYKIFIHFLSATVVNNKAHRHENGHCTAVFCIHNTEEVSLSNSIFVGNNGSALYVKGSNLYIYSVVNITDNHGVSGGGLYFDCNPQSFLYLTPHYMPIIQHHSMEGQWLPKTAVLRLIKPNALFKYLMKMQSVHHYLMKQ